MIQDPLFKSYWPRIVEVYNSEMLRLAQVLSLFSSLSSVFAAAQYGTAPNNYYPDKYNGSTFTGTVTETKEDQITLTYAKGNKTDSFVGRLEAGCSVPRSDGSDRKMNASDIPQGTILTAFFNRNDRKVDGQSIKENLVLAITFVNVRGQSIPEDKRKIYLCTAEKHVQFRAYR